MLSSFGSMSNPILELLRAEQYVRASRALCVCNTAATIQVRPSVPSLFPVEAVYAVLPVVPEVHGLRSTLCWSGLRFSSLPPFGRRCLQCAALRRAEGDVDEPLLALEALQVVASCGLCIVLRSPLHVSDSDLWGRANMIECLNAWGLRGLSVCCDLTVAVWQC